MSGANAQFEKTFGLDIIEQIKKTV